MDLLLLLIGVPLIALLVVGVVFFSLYLYAPDLLLNFIDSFSSKKNLKEHFVQKQEDYDAQVQEPDYPPQEEYEQEPQPEPPRRRRYG